MTIEDKKEIIKAYIYKYDFSTIAENYKITEDELKDLIEEYKDYINELEERTYD